MEIEQARTRTSQKDTTVNSYPIYLLIYQLSLAHHLALAEHEIALCEVDRVKFIEL